MPNPFCLALYWFYINKYIEIGTTYESEQLHAWYYTRSLSETGSENPTIYNEIHHFPCHATSSADQNQNLALKGCQKWPRHGAEPQSGAGCYPLQVANVGCTSA